MLDTLHNLRHLINLRTFKNFIQIIESFIDFKVLYAVKLKLNFLKISYKYLKDISVIKVYKAQYILMYNKM